MEQATSAGSDAPIIDPMFYDAPGDADYKQENDIREGSLGLPIPWEAWIRCVFIFLMLAMICFFTWRPGLGRLSLLFSMVNPSRGERLEWRAIDDPVPLPPPVKRLPPPSEWRLSPTLSTAWNINKPASNLATQSASAWAGRGWLRTTENAWSWQDDAIRARKDGEPLPPPQKSMTAFRAGDIEAWPQIIVPAAQPAVAATGWNAAPVDNAAAFTPPQLPDVPRPTTEPAVGAVREIPPPPAIEVPEQPALFGNLPALPGTRETAAATPPVPLAAVDAPPSSASLSPSLANSQPAAVSPAPAEPVDWKNREITGTIENSYLIIYPKLRFVGLCVPGQGYIRKYNQVSVPRELEGPKMRADDGRVPYGSYYIADRHLDADGPRLFLSWPSVEDAKRIGLDPTQLAKVEHAWSRQDLPPQNTNAGGGVGLNGLAQWVDKTDGGFALEAPHMEEIFTALPDKAKVFIQP